MNTDKQGSRQVRNLGKRLVRFIRNGTGVHIGPVRADTADFLVTHGVDVVIDVGANTGQFGKDIRINGYRGQIISYEPLSAAFGKLEASARAHGNWTAHKLGMAAQEGVADIHIAENTQCSSILEETPAATKHYEHARYIGTEQIRLTTLDKAMAPFEGKRVFVKIDTQGYEEQVLRGGAQSLSKAIGVLLELPAVHMYAGVWSLGAAMRYMEDAGFILAQAHPVNTYKDDRTSAVEFDCLFRSTQLASAYT